MQSIPEADLLPITANLSDEGRLAIGGCDVRELVEQYGSPLYIYDEATLRGMCKDFVGSFTAEYPNTRIEYSAKAFTNPAVSRIVEEEGLDMDVVTGGELAVAKATDFPAWREAAGDAPLIAEHRSSHASAYINWNTRFQVRIFYRNR